MRRDESDGGTADLPSARVDVAGLPPGERPGDSIGPYKLLGVLGEGGFGIVYLAERREPIVQRVALKVIKPGMDSRAVIARFEQERQALAVMDHPNVARVFDAGATISGRPYFVMEHVAGEPITDYCDRQSLSIRGRLELFIPVCEAVQHAHMKGIIHRDLKPSNILVSVKDGQAIPKVIDFGVAKAITQTLTAKTIFTEQGVLIGTPEYMSPEQAEMGATDIDTRSDVYSLGVVLYELLTGALPFDPRELRRAAFVRIQQMIRDMEPPRPSTRLSTLGADGTEIAKRRQMQLTELAAALRRELEWLPLKAMRKDRTQRYQTAAAMADDLRNYLADRPLVAGPERAAYKVKKFVRRHRGPVAAAAVVALALVVGVAGTTWGMMRAQRAERAAREEQAISRRVVDFLNDELLGAQDAENADPDVRVVTVIDRAAGAAARDLGATPALASRVAYSLGRSYLALGAPRQAEGQLRSSLEAQAAIEGVGGELLTEIAARLAEALYRQGRAQEAAELLAPHIAARERTAGADDAAVLNAKNQLGGALKWLGKLDESEAVYKEVAQRRTRTLGAGHAATLITEYNLALIALKRGEALRDVEQRAEAAAAQFETAAGEMKGVWDRMKRHLGEHNRWTLAAASEYASLLNRLGRAGEAAPIYRAVIPEMRRWLGERSWRTLEALANYGRLCQRSGDVEAAIGAYEEALPAYRDIRGKTYGDTRTIALWLAAAYVARGEVARARETAEGVWADLTADSSVSDESRREFAGRAARALREAGDGEGAGVWEGRAGGMGG